MAEAAKIIVTLDPGIEDFVREEVERGDFASASDYVEDLIRQRHERNLANRELDAALQRGIDDIEAGRYLPIEEAFAEVRSRLGIATKRK